MRDRMKDGLRGPLCPNCGSKDMFYNWQQERIYWGDYDGHLYAVKYDTGTSGTQKP